MSQDIWKYEFTVNDVVDIQMPRVTEILCAAKQPGVPIGTIAVWGLVDKTREVVTRRLFIYGTGRTLPPFLGRYIDTVIDGDAVWHVFDGGETDVAGRPDPRAPIPTPTR